MSAAVVELRRSPSGVEVAEAMYQAGKVGAGPKMPEYLDEVNAKTQERYLLLACAAIAITGEPPSLMVTPDDGGAQLLDDLAHQLAFKLNNPMWFADGVRDVLERYATHVGENRVDDEVRKAMAI
jgi:hypothetical protein